MLSASAMNRPRLALASLRSIVAAPGLSALRCLVTVLLTYAAACDGSHDRAAVDGGSRDGGSRDGSSRDGAAPADSRVEDADAAVDPEPCPNEAPTPGAACAVEGSTCWYLLCETRGQIEATCTGAAWSVAESPCEAQCGRTDVTCEPGQICIMHVGGAVSESCEPNPCSTGPLTCDCVCGEGGCTEFPETSNPPGYWVCNVCTDPAGCA